MTRDATVSGKHGSEITISAVTCAEQYEKTRNDVERLGMTWSDVGRLRANRNDSDRLEAMRSDSE
jgi:hypothetical protein